MHRIEIVVPGLKDLPASIKLRTALTQIKTKACLPNIRVTKMLASTLPDFTLLQHFILNTRKDDVMAIGCSLKAWPPQTAWSHTRPNEALAGTGSTSGGCSMGR